MTRHPELQSKWEKSFRARRYYVYTIGNITEDAIKKLMEIKGLKYCKEIKKRAKETLERKLVIITNN